MKIAIVDVDGGLREINAVALLRKKAMQTGRE